LGGRRAIKKKMRGLAPTAGPRSANGLASSVDFYSYAARAQRTAVAQKLEQQGRFAGGKTFFQNGDKWIDSDVQKKQNAKRVQVQFGSQEYFDLAKKPAARSWLAQSRNVEFVLGDTIYEVVD